MSNAIVTKWKLVPVILCLIGLLFCIQLSVASSKESAHDMGFEVTPQYIQFHKLAPGLSKEGTVTVKNVGLYPLTCHMVVKKGQEPNDVRLFNILNLKLTDYNVGKIYEGKLENVFGHSFDAVLLQPGDIHQLTWAISLPREAGNEYQDKKGDYKIIFSARGNGWDNDTGSGDDTGGGDNDAGSGDNDTGSGDNDTGSGGVQYGGESKIPGPDEVVTHPAEPSVNPDLPPGEKQSGPGYAPTPDGGPGFSPIPGDGGLPFTGGSYNGYLLGGLGLLICGIYISFRAGRRS